MNVWMKRVLLLIRFVATVVLFIAALLVAASCVEVTNVNQQPEQFFFSMLTVSVSIFLGLILGSPAPEYFDWLVLTSICSLLGMVLMILNGPISPLQVVALPVLGILFGLVFPIPRKRIFENS